MCIYCPRSGADATVFRGFPVQNAAYTAASATFQEPDWTRRVIRRIVGSCALGFPLPSYGGRLCLRAPRFYACVRVECGAWLSGTTEHSTLTTRKRAPPRAHGGNPLGCCAQRIHHHHHERPRSFPPLVRQDLRHAGGPRPPGAADRVLRLA